MDAIEDAMITLKDPESSITANPDDLRDGTSLHTVATPDDFPESYANGSGEITDYTRGDMLKKLPKLNGNDTVFQAFYL